MSHICTPMFHPPITYKYYKHNSIEFWSINIAKLEEITTISMAFSIPHFTNCRISSIIRSKASPTQLRTSRWTMRKWPISTRISRGTCKAYLVSQRFLMLMDGKPPDMTKRDTVTVVC